MANIMLFSDIIAVETFKIIYFFRLLFVLSQFFVFYYYFIRLMLFHMI